MPVWVETVRLSDVWAVGLPWNEVRDVVVQRLKATEWYQASTIVPELVQELEGSTTVQEFDYTWSYVYDEADADRVWIEVF